MHVFTFGGLTLSSANHMMVGRSCSSRQGGEMLVRGVRRGFCVPCWLGPPCKVKSNRFAVSRSYEGLDLFAASYQNVRM